MNGERVRALSSLCVIVLSIQPLGSTALQTTQGISHVMRSVSKFAIFALKRRVAGAGGEAIAGSEVRASPSAAASSVCASLRRGTGESGAGRRMWVFTRGRACALGSALDLKRWSVTKKSPCLFMHCRRAGVRISRVKGSRA